MKLSYWKRKAWKQRYYHDDKNSRFLALVKDPNADYSFQTFDAYNKELISPISALPNVFSEKKSY
jgi:hypothetical protein